MGPLSPRVWVDTLVARVQVGAADIVATDPPRLQPCSGYFVVVAYNLVKIHTTRYHQCSVNGLGYRLYKADPIAPVQCSCAEAM